MKTHEFQGMCELVGEGRLTWVEHMESHTPGRVIACGNDMLEVEVAGHHESWDPSCCREMTFGYRVNYDEVRRHPHEFDSHRD